MELAQACKDTGLRPIHGAELTVSDGGEPFHLTALVESAAGWHNLCRLLTEAHADTRPRPDQPPLPPVLALDSLLERNEGIVCLTGCARQGALAGPWERGEPRRAEGRARRLLASFGRERLRVELQRPMWRRDRARNRWLAGVAERLGVACVATGNVHAHDRARAELQDALVAVRTHTTLEESEPLRRGNASSVLAAPAAMAARFAEHPEAVAETTRLAARLSFDLTSQLGYRYPGAEDPEADRTLAEICRGRLDLRYAGLPEAAEAERRLEDELAVIRKLGLSGFFLLHFDLLELAREVAVEVRGPDSARNLLPPGRGRGSSVSSVVCYLTGLSHVDPVRAGLFLGRFLNDEISEMPDIDLDFPRDIRERLIPSDPRALRARALGAGLGLRQLPLARRRPRPRQGARAAAGRDRAGRPGGRRLRPRRRGRARHRRGRSARRGRRTAALALARAPRPRGLGAAAPSLPAPGRDGALDPAAGRHLPGAAGGDGGAPDRPVGQGLVRGRGLFEDRPARARDAVGGRALRRVDRRGARRAHRPLADPARRRARPSRRSGRRRPPACSRSRAGRRCRCCPAASPRPSTT